MGCAAAGALGRPKPSTSWFAMPRISSAVLSRAHAGALGPARQGLGLGGAAGALVGVPEGAGEDSPDVGLVVPLGSFGMMVPRTQEVIDNRRRSFEGEYDPTLKQIGVVPQPAHQRRELLLIQALARLGVMAPRGSRTQAHE